MRELFNKIFWQYGNCRNYYARKNRFTGEVQFRRKKVGEEGHLKDIWLTFDSFWWKEFKEFKKL